MAKNLKEASIELANDQGLCPQEIIDDEIIMEIEAEEGLDFVVWIHDDGHRAKVGEAIGYVVIDGTSEVFTPYDQYTDEGEL